MTGAGGPVDEALDADGRDRPHAAAALDAVRARGPGALAVQLRAATEALPLRHGVAGEEHVYPLDPVPRVLTAAEFEHLAAGLAQRLRALEAFVADAHGPREAVRAGVVPAAVVETNQYVEPGLPAPRLWIGVYGPDVVRGADGRLVVLEDNTRTPTMLAYALAARDLVGDPLGVRPGPRPVRGAARDGLVRVLRAAAGTASGQSDPVVAVLGDGPRSAVPWEVDVLAELVGATSVQAPDLHRRGDRLVLPDGRGVDVVWRRTNEERLRDRDGRPTDLGELLVGPLRAGTVAVVNAPGTGVADDKRTHPHVDDLVRFFTGDEPLLPSVPSLDLGDPAQLEQALDRLDELVLKPRSGSGGRGVLIGPRASAQQIAQARADVLADPGGWVAQEPVAISTHPTVVDGQLVPRHVDLRPFAFWDGQEVTVLPGGLTRVALAEGELVVNAAQGGGGKDTWVLPAAPEDDLPPLTAEQVRKTLEQVRR